MFRVDTMLSRCAPKPCITNQPESQPPTAPATGVMNRDGVALADALASRGTTGGPPQFSTGSTAVPGQDRTTNAYRVPFIAYAYPSGSPMHATSREENGMLLSIWQAAHAVAPTSGCIDVLPCWVMAPGLARRWNLRVSGADSQRVRLDVRRASQARWEHTNERAPQRGKTLRHSLPRTGSNLNDDQV